MRVVVESPLRGKTREDTRENLRYLLWCCRAVYLAGYSPIASHLVCSWFMDDSDAKERADGIDWSWMWEPGVPHWFFVDAGKEQFGKVRFSSGMELAQKRCRDLGIPDRCTRLQDFDQGCWAAYQRGEWPPHTKGLELT